VDYRELGQAFAKLRREQGASQQQVADAVGISRATINAFETGRAGDVGLKKVLRLADYLGYELCIRPASPFPTLEELVREL
jgi:transcriptional regulator with XRE-family HTH domain